MDRPADARVALLARLIDHAPLFPPASLTLSEALEADDRARASDAAFALARFVCPASRVGELPVSERSMSVVLDAALPVDPRVDAVETAWREDLESLADLAPEVYVELPLDHALERRLDALADLGLRAKVRCGGASVPTPAELARFLQSCAERGVVFKATAGLHHAISRDGEHGFLNLLAAVVFAGEEEDALGERDPAAFTLARDELSWRGHVAGPEDLARARSERLHSIGSCSFFEPIEELEELGILPV